VSSIDASDSVTTRRHIGAPLGVRPFLIATLLVPFSADRQAETPTEPAQNGETRAAERLEIRGIENTFRLSPRLYSGGEPHGVEAFTALKALGVKSIISVDGAPPDAETAGKLGLRYVHLPIGYNGVPREQGVKLVRALRTLPGPVYVHCHHGKHRGPAAAAVCGIATERWSTERALAWMKVAGTSPEYRGLYASARDFLPPSAGELESVANALPERAKVPALVEMMVQVDERWDHLKAARTAGFNAPPGQPDIDPPHEALQLAELFREMLRLPETKGRDSAFLAAAEAAERTATSLAAALRAFAAEPTAEGRQPLESAFLAAGKSCTSCHARHRDN
jgi:protein tyrosine phosphatase (PTP) superfamily phosphohydrolase (DUF442 family)